MSDQIEKQQFSTASYIADIIENQVKLRINLLHTIATLITPQLIANPVHLKEFLRRSPLLSSLFQTGVVVISKDGKGIADYPSLSGRSSASYGEMEYFQEVFATKRAAVGKPRFGRFSNKPVISFAVPVLSPSGELNAVLAGFTLLSDPVLLGAFKSSIYKDFPDGLLLSSPKYRIHIIGSDSTRNMTPTPETGRNPLFDRFMAGYEGSGNTVNIRGVRIFLSAKQIPSAGWFVRVGMPTDIAFAPIHEMKNLVYSITFGLSLLSCLVVGLVIRHSLGPLYTAIELIQSITEGTQPLQDIPVIQHDEIGQLLTSFNIHMTYRKEAEKALQKQRAEEVLLESREQHRTIIQTAMDGFWMADMQGHLLEVNETYSQMSGYSVQELLAMRIPDLEVIETPADLAAHIQRIKAQGEDRFETRHRSKDGSIFTVEVSVQYRPIEGGRLVAFLRDITERRLIEAALRESEEKFRTIFDRASDGILIADPITKHFLHGNATICSMLKYTEAEVASLTINDIHPPQELPHVLEEFKKQICGEKVLAESLPLLRKDGSVFYADVCSAPISIGGKNYLVGIFRDITERKDAEQNLRKQREELSHVSRVATVGEFAASIAHEIHQPLTAILNNAQAAQRFLSSDTPAIDEVSDAIQDIIADDRRAAEVIRHLRMFLKRDEADPAILDINTIIGEVLTILHGEILDKNISVTPDLSPDLPHILGGQIELQQVLMNLILNGCDAMMNVDRQRRQMRIVTSVDGPSNIIIAVQDSGTGLDKSVIEHVFEPYYTTKKEGLGMGLSISKSIIAAHGGRIWAANNPEGGATFSFTLPIAKEGC